MSTLFKGINLSANQPAQAGSGPAQVYRNRLSYLTMANVTEMVSRTVIGVVNANAGVGNELNGSKIATADIAALFANRVAKAATEKGAE